MEAINFFFGVCQRNIDRAIIDGKAQVIWFSIENNWFTKLLQKLYTVGLISASIGLCCGLAFGLLDVEDAHGVEIRTIFRTELMITTNFGLAVGCLGGFANEYLRQTVYKPSLSNVLTSHCYRVAIKNLNHLITLKRKFKRLSHDIFRAQPTLFSGFTYWNTKNLAYISRKSLSKGDLFKLLVTFRKCTLNFFSVWNKLS